MGLQLRGLACGNADGYFAWKAFTAMSLGWAPAGSMVTSSGPDLLWGADDGHVTGAGVGDEEDVLVGG